MINADYFDGMRAGIRLHHSATDGVGDPLVEAMEKVKEMERETRISTGDLQNPREALRDLPPGVRKGVAEFGFLGSLLRDLTQMHEVRDKVPDDYVWHQKAAMGAWWSIRELWDKEAFFTIDTVQKKSEELQCLDITVKIEYLVKAFVASRDERASFYLDAMLEDLK